MPFPPVHFGLAELSLESGGRALNSRGLSPPILEQKRLKSLEGLKKLNRFLGKY